MNKELNLWKQSKDIINNSVKDKRIELGSCYSYILKNTPRRLLFNLSYHKFAAKILGENKYVLSVGCNEGMGTCLLAEFAAKVVGIDFDLDVINVANKNYKSDKLSFIHADFLKLEMDKFDAVVSFDVIEHIFPENEKNFFNSISRNLKNDGICIVGTPNITSDIYAGELNKKTHINLYSWDRLRDVMKSYFQHVLIFSANDEIVHTGFYPMAHYLIAVGINKIEV